MFIFNFVRSVVHQANMMDNSKQSKSNLMETITRSSTQI